MNKILEINHLNKLFGDFQAVKDLSFNVYEGDIYGFLGPNGAGKSTTLRMILGLIYPSSGEIMFLGKKISHDCRGYLSNLGALIERPDFYGNLSAYDNLRILAELSGLGNVSNRIDEVLEEVNLLSRKDSRVKTFSQGMKQRLGIAQAIMHNPKLVILDEPSNGLDPQGQSDMRSLIRRINKDRGITVLFSSHILSEVEEICNRMIIINNGTKIKEGNAANLMNEESLNVLVKATDKNLLVASLGAVNLNFTIVSDEVYVAIQEMEIPAMISKLVGRGVDILEVNQNRNLENYFLKMTSKSDV